MKYFDSELLPIIEDYQQQRMFCLTQAERNKDNLMYLKQNSIAMKEARDTFIKEWRAAQNVCI